MKHYVDKSPSTARDGRISKKKKKSRILFFTIGATVYRIITIGINTIIYYFSPDRFLDSALTRGSCFCRFYVIPMRMTRACFIRFDPLLERIPVTQDIKTFTYV